MEWLAKEVEVAGRKVKLINLILITIVAFGIILGLLAVAVRAPPSDIERSETEVEEFVASGESHRTYVTRTREETTSQDKIASDFSPYVLGKDIFADGTFNPTDACDLDYLRDLLELPSDAEALFCRKSVLEGNKFMAVMFNYTNGLKGLLQFHDKIMIRNFNYEFLDLPYLGYEPYTKSEYDVDIHYYYSTNEDLVLLLYDMHRIKKHTTFYLNKKILFAINAIWQNDEESFLVLTVDEGLPGFGEFFKWVIGSHVGDWNPMWKKYYRGSRWVRLEVGFRAWRCCYDFKYVTAKPTEIYYVKDTPALPLTTNLKIERETSVTLPKPKQLMLLTTLPIKMIETNCPGAPVFQCYSEGYPMWGQCQKQDGRYTDYYSRLRGLFYWRNDVSYICPVSFSPYPTTFYWEYGNALITFKSRNKWEEHYENLKDRFQISDEVWGIVDRYIGYPPDVQHINFDGNEWTLEEGEREVATGLVAGFWFETDPATRIYTLVSSLGGTLLLDKNEVYLRTDKPVEGEESLTFITKVENPLPTDKIKILGEQCTIPVGLIQHLRALLEALARWFLGTFWGEQYCDVAGSLGGLTRINPEVTSPREEPIMFAWYPARVPDERLRTTNIDTYVYSKQAPNNIYYANYVWSGIGEIVYPGDALTYFEIEGKKYFMFEPKLIMLYESYPGIGVIYVNEVVE